MGRKIQLSNKTLEEKIKFHDSFKSLKLAPFLCSNAGAIHGRLERNSKKHIWNKPGTAQGVIINFRINVLAKIGDLIRKWEEISRSMNLNLTLRDTIRKRTFALPAEIYLQ